MQSSLTSRFSSLALISLCPLAFANNDADPEMTALLALLAEETAIATQSKMNADYVPGMVSVLHSENLQTYGVTTIADALDKVAGFYLTINNAGDHVAVVRGVGASLNATNLKILLNGVAINRATDASADSFLRLPISLIDRIEIVRGPGSAIYGEYAFSGVINIITKDANNLVAVANDQQRIELNYNFNQQWENGAWLTINTAIWDQPNSNRKTDLDNFYSSGKGFSPGNINDNEQGKFFNLVSSIADYRFDLQFINTKRGGYYGRNAAMPVELEPRDETALNFQVSKTWTLSESLSIDASIAAQQTELAIATFLPIPEGIDPPGPPPPILENEYRRDGNKDNTQRVKVAANWQASANHLVFAEVSGAHYEVDSAFGYRYPLGGDPIYSQPGSTQVLAGSKRTLTSFTLQDQWKVTPNFELTLGARYDDYDNWGTNTSPRVAAVWRIDNHHIVKGQYAEAFRPPTLQEQFPGQFIPGFVANPLDQESLNSAEFAYLYRESNYSFRATLFDTKVKDLIEFYLQPGQPPTLRNRGDIETVGIELEWQHKINHQLEWFANISKIDASDKLDVDGDQTGAVETLINAGIQWQSSDFRKHGLNLRYIGEQEGWEIQTRLSQTDRFNDFIRINYSFVQEQLFSNPALNLQFSILNLADEEVNVLPNPAQFPKGLPQMGRSAWLSLNYSIN